ERIAAGAERVAKCNANRFESRARIVQAGFLENAMPEESGLHRPLELRHGLLDLRQPEQPIELGPALKEGLEARELAQDRTKGVELRFRESRCSEALPQIRSRLAE